MNTTKKIAIALAVIMVAAMAAQTVTGSTQDLGYSATICTGQVTSVGVVDIAFGDILLGKSKELAPSFNLTNTGDWAAKIEAKFTTNNGTTWGLKNESTGNMLPGNNFGLKAIDLGETTYMNLASTDTDTIIPPVLPDNSTTYNYDAQLTAPPSQAPGSYMGTVQLTFSNV